MKKTLLFVLGLSLFALDGFAQRGQGQGRGRDRDIRAERGRETTINHRPNNGRHQYAYVAPRKRGRRPAVVHRRGNETVIIRRHPGIRYTRPVVYQRPIVVRPHIRYNRGYRYGNVLRTGQVNNIAESMSYARFDDEALQIAKNRIRRNAIRSEDVAYLMSQLNFEDNRLALAKFAWSRTVDRRNFNLVFNELKFRSSQRELDRFIGRF